LGCNAGCTYDYSGCVAAPVCGNGVREGVEQCDGGDLASQSCQSLGFAMGTLSCTAGCAFDMSSCVAPPMCGNGSIEGTEQCDGPSLGGHSCEEYGYGGGTIGCTSGCMLDPVGCWQCGNGIQDPDEDCDGFVVMDECGIGCTGGNYCDNCQLVFIPCECCMDDPWGPILC
jgi:hypothetical protein